MARLLDSVDIQVTVVSAKNLPKSGALQNRHYVVAISVDGHEQKTEGRAASDPSWNQSLTFAIHAHSRLQASLLCTSMGRTQKSVVGKSDNMVVLEMARNHDISMVFRDPRGRNRGSMTICLKVAIQPVLEEFREQNLQHGYQIHPGWISLHNSLEHLGKLVRAISHLHPMVHAALLAVTAVVELAVIQTERDYRINQLSSTVAALYDLWLDINPMSVIKSYQKTIERLLRQTTECAYFIIEYWKTSNLAQRAVQGFIFNVDAMITAYEVSFGELKIEFMMGSMLQTEIKVDRILAKVDDISDSINLSCLPYMPNASWDPSCSCIMGTNIRILDDILHWFINSSARHYALLGRPRCGKSSISHTIAEMLHKEGRLGSSIFLDREAKDRNNSAQIFSTMARDLAALDEKLKTVIARAIKFEPGLPVNAIERQFQSLIVKPTQDLTIVGPIMLIVDGIDNCKDLKDRCRLLRILTRESASLHVNIRILITARPEDDIIAAFSAAENTMWRIVNYDENCDDDLNVPDVNMYIEDSLNKLSREKPACFQLPTFETVLAELVERFMEIPLCATTAFRFLGMASERDTTLFLDKVISQSRPSSTQESIDKIYLAILQIVSTEPRFNPGWQAFLRVLLQTPPMLPIVSMKSLRSLSSPLVHHPIDTLHRIGCILETDDLHAIHLHPSLEAFLTNDQRCTDQRFFIDVTIVHEPLAEICLHIMNSFLSRNVCKIKNASLLNSELAQRPKCIIQFVSDCLRYACKNWLSHVVSMKPDGSASDLIELLRRFLFSHLLHWIELSSLLGEFDTVLPSLKSLYRWLEHSATPPGDLLEMTMDGVRFVQSFHDVISNAALHTYISALPVSLPESRLYKTYILEPVEERPWVVHNQEEEWQCSGILRGHTAVVDSVVFSPMDLKVISSSKDKTIRIWNPQIGNLLTEPLRGHEGRVCRAAISPDGSKITSCSSDQTLRSWDTITGQSFGKPLQGHRETIRWVTYYPSGSRIASWSEQDGKIRIWHADTGDCIHEVSIKGENEVHCVALCPDENRLATGSSDKTVQIWKLEAGCTLVSVLEGHEGEVYSVDWSQNGSLLASGSADLSIRLWDTKLNITIYTLVGHTNLVTCVAFSPDSSKLVSASLDMTMRLWDTRTGHHIGCPLKGHEGAINSVAFSPDGQCIASGSEDKTVRVWTMQKPRRIEFYPPPKLSDVIMSDRPSTSSVLPDNHITSHISYIDESGWARTSAGQRVVWVPIPLAELCVESDRLVLEGRNGGTPLRFLPNSLLASRSDAL